MYMGHSSSRGIVIGDTALPAPNAVYGCWRSGEIVLEKGEFKELLKRQDQEAGPPVWLTLQNLSASPIYDAECGTVYAGYFLTLTVEIGLFLSTFVEIGFLKAMSILLITIVVLFILIFIPWNPYKRLQYPAVAQPGEKEYELGLAVLEKYLIDIRHISVEQ